MISRIATALLLSAHVPAMAAGYFTYAQWAAMPPNLRGAYIAGSFDALVNVADNAEGAKASKHYGLCLHSAKMDNGQLAENILRLASTRPALQTNSVQHALVLYLIEACGKP